MLVAMSVEMGTAQDVVKPVAEKELVAGTSVL